VNKQLHGGLRADQQALPKPLDRSWPASVNYHPDQKYWPGKPTRWTNQFESCNLHTSIPFFPSSFILIPSLIPLPYYLNFNSYVNKFYLSSPLLYRKRILIPFIYNMIGCIDNSANGIVLHLNIWFGIKSINLLLLHSVQHQVHPTPQKIIS
jgi:hypothetical protein